MGTGGYANPTELDGHVAGAAVVASLLSYFLGSNDAANSLATAVGSGALPLRTAVAVGALMAFLGATLLGGNVSDTVERFSGTESEGCWPCGEEGQPNSMGLYIVVMLSSLVGATVFLFGATSLAMPVSTTHAVVGAVASATVISEDWHCLRWGFDGGVASITLSWLTSPLVSGVTAASVYSATRTTIALPSSQWLSRLKLSHQRLASISFPVIFYLQALIVSFLVFTKVPSLGSLPTWTLAIAANLVAAACAGVAFVLSSTIRRASEDMERASGEELELLRQGSAGSDDSGSYPPAAEEAMPIKQRILEAEHRSVRGGVYGHELRFTKHNSESSTANTSSGSFLDHSSPGSAHGSNATPAARPLTSGRGNQNSSFPDHAGPPNGESTDYSAGNACTRKLHPSIRVEFTYLLVFISGMKALSHGSNDIANAAGGFSAVWHTWNGKCGTQRTPLWILACTGAFVAIGILTYGYKVIETMGKKLTSLDLHQSWCIELATTLAVLLATVIGLPISTTHCQVRRVRDNSADQKRNALSKF